MSNDSYQHSIINDSRKRYSLLISTFIYNRNDYMLIDESKYLKKNETKRPSQNVTFENTLSKESIEFGMFILNLKDGIPHFPYKDDSFNRYFLEIFLSKTH